MKNASIGVRVLVAVFTVLAALAASVSGATPAQSEVAEPEGFVFIDGNSAGWLLADGNRQWISPDCRADLEAAGTAFSLISWQTFSFLNRVDPGPCPMPDGPMFYTLDGKSGPGWVAQNGTREWVSSSCRAQLEAAGTTFMPSTWTALSGLNRVTPGSCERFLPAPARFATFNASLNRNNAGDLVAELTDATNGTVTDQLAAVMTIIATNDADVLLINEFDYDTNGEAAALFAQLTNYPYWYSAPSNTGIASGVDLDNSGDVGGPGDAFGFGFHEGQFGMLVLSKYPISTNSVRTFQNFLWKDMPGALLPVNPDNSMWYSDDELDVFRLSSKSHWDVPVTIDGNIVHFLVSHPTPPVFDGPEDRNGTRNHDEIRLWADYVTGGAAASYIYDDAGMSGGLGVGSNGGGSFVIAGDLNSDPYDGDSIPGSAQLLLNNPQVNTAMTPSSAGGAEAEGQGAPNAAHGTPARFDTADFGEAQFGGPGNLRVDYVLPSADLNIVGSGVFWPASGQPGSELTGAFPFPSSDHRMVWVDIRLTPWAQYS